MADEKQTHTEEYTRTTIANLANGALAEQFDKTLLEVLNNIDDLDTDPKAKRKITITLVFEPNEARKMIVVTPKVEAKLAGPKPIAAVVFKTRDRSGDVFAVNDNADQINLFEKKNSN